MAVLLSNNAISKLASSLTTGATSLSLTAGTGALFPSPSGGDWFPVTVIKSTGQLEIMKCTARSTDTLTVTRAQEGTTAKAFSAGDRVELRLTVAALNAALADFQPLAANLTALAGLAGSANKLPIFSGAGAMGLQTLSAFMATVLDDADATTARDTLGANNAGNLTKGILPNDRVSVGLPPDKAFRRGNILGTVAQSGGVPTGALIEAGNNANGYYARYADGTQICWVKVIISGFISSQLISGTWWFPAAFANAETISVVHSPDADYLYAKSVSHMTQYASLHGAKTATSVNLLQSAASGTYSSGKSSQNLAIAVGRWF